MFQNTPLPGLVTAIMLLHPGCMPSGNWVASCGLGCPDEFVMEKPVMDWGPAHMVLL